jgi:hypothetical protein
MVFPLKGMIRVQPVGSLVAIDILNQQPILQFAPGDSCCRATLVAQWNALVRKALPSMAAQHRWPISQDHCFMRVCLDTAVGAPWHRVVKRPAIRNLSDDQLVAAIAIAEGLMLAPETLDALNRQSILWRKNIRATAP